MTVNEWIATGCNYKVGLALYAELPNYNKNLLKVWTRKQTTQSEMKLRYELQKHLQPTFKAPTSATINEPKKQYRKVLINQLPVELHGVYLQQKNDFGLACSLKIQLNAMGHFYDNQGNLIIGANGLPKLKPQTPETQERARKICLKIETLFDSIDKTWGIIDYYFEHKVTPQINSNNFSKLSPGKLRDKIISVRSSRTRQNQRLKMLQQKLDNAIAKKFIEKYKRNIEKCENSLMQLNQDLIKLIELRDNEK